MRLFMRLVIALPLILLAWPAAAQATQNEDPQHPRSTPPVIASEAKQSPSALS
jgi:hypothetical protein